MRRSTRVLSNMIVKDAYSGALVGEIPLDTAATVAEKFAKAKAAQVAWAATDYKDRAECVSKFSALVEKNADELAALMSAEMGKPVAHAKGEIMATIPRLQFFLDHTEAVVADQKVRVGEAAAGTEETIKFEPLGVVANISAWNFPYFVGSNVWVPALLTGSAVLYKPSEWTAMTGVKVAEMFVEAGVPSDVFAAVVGGGDVGAQLLSEDINGLFFTGSLATGQKLAAVTAPRMIRTQLELGGKDPHYVCDDVADVKGAAAALCDGAMFNAGQSCCSVERIYVHESIAEEFIAGVVETAESFKMGDPTSSDTYIGPMALPTAPGFLQSQVDDAVAKGATLHVGGALIPDQPRFYPPTVLSGVDHTMSLMRDESFGPIIGIQTVSSDEEALALMNDTEFGLTSGVWSADQARAEGLLAQVNSGTAYWNCGDRVSPFLPWSGRKGSGVGATLSTIGIQSFVIPKGYHLRA